MKNPQKKDYHALKWIIGTSKPQWKFVVLLVVLNGILATFGTVCALISKELVDSATGGKIKTLLLFAGIYLGISVLQILMSVFLRYLNEKCRAKLDITFKRKTFGIQLKKQYANIRTYHSGELVNRLTGDVGVITDAVTGIVPTLTSIAVRLICAFVVLTYMQWQFSIVFAVGGCIMFVATRLMRDKIKQLHKDMQKADGKTRSFWQEIFENLLVIKSFGAENKSEHKADELLDEHYKVRMKKAAYGAVSSGANHAVMRFGYIFALVWCAYAILNKEMTFGSLTAITALVAQVQQPFLSLSGIVPRYYAAISSAERLIELDELPDEQNPDSSFRIDDVKQAYCDFQRIDVKNVTFAYEMDNIMEDVTLSINKGDFVSITGLSGIGKSTLFKLLLDIYEPTEGKIDFVFNGKDQKICPEIRKLFAYVPQGNMLLSGTIRENLLFMAQSTDEESIQKALQLTCSDEFVKNTSDGLETVIGEGGLGLSEGQVQRIAVARAILSDAPILLLDEATSALDELTEAKMLKNLQQLTDKTCIIVTHKKAALDICNKRIHMENKHMTMAEI